MLIVNTIAIILVALIVMLLVLATAKSGTFRIQRSTSIKAPPEKVFALINDFHSWGAWSPWEKLDPAMQRIYSGTASGIGTVYEWSGAGKVGAGRMEITEASLPSKIIIKLDFIKPFEGHNVAEFNLETRADSTNVTWSMCGPSPYMVKLMGIFFNMDQLIGKDFEAGLTNLKNISEK